MWCGCPKEFGAAFIIQDEVTLCPSLLKKWLKTNACRQNRRPIIAPSEGWNLPFQKNGLFSFKILCTVFCVVGAEKDLYYVKKYPQNAIFPKIKHFYR
jgi:hypothetical protein